MERNDTASTQGETSRNRKVTCAKCGLVAKPSHGWVKGADGTILCALCHRDLISQNIDDRYAEMFGHEMAHYFSSIRKRYKVKSYT